MAKTVTLDDIRLVDCLVLVCITYTYRQRLIQISRRASDGALTELSVSIFVLRIFGLKIEVIFNDVVGTGHGGKLW